MFTRPKPGLFRVVTNRVRVERRPQIIWNSQWPPALSIDVDPVGLSLNQDALVVRSGDQIPAKGAAWFNFGHPGLDRDRLPCESRPNVGDKMRPNDPDRPVLQIALHRPTLGG